MESTKARIIGIVRLIYDAIVSAIPKDLTVPVLREEEEVEGIFCMFFTNMGTQSMTIGTLDQDAVLDYLDEVLTARYIAMGRNRGVVTTEDVELAKAEREARKMP